MIRLLKNNGKVEKIEIPQTYKYWEVWGISHIFAR